jgi:hypothetical protein
MLQAHDDAKHGIAGEEHQQPEFNMIHGRATPLSNWSLQLGSFKRI